MKQKHLLFGAMTALVVLGGCGTQNTHTTQTQQPAAHDHAASHDHSASAESGDIQETTAAVTALPNFLNNQDPLIVKAYQAAAAHKDLLKYIPCYCGCESIGHTSNQSCFIKEVKPDGSVVWDDHGTRCTTCMDIAVTSGKLQDAGKSAMEIRQIVDAKYKVGYAKPTPTPMPMN